MYGNECEGYMDVFHIWLYIVMNIYIRYTYLYILMHEKLFTIYNSSEFRIVYYSGYHFISNIIWKIFKKLKYVHVIICIFTKI